MLTSAMLNFDVAMTSARNVLTTELRDIQYKQYIDNTCCYSFFIYPTDQIRVCEIIRFLHTRQGFPQFSPVLTNLILHTLIRPVGYIKSEYQHVLSIHWLYRMSRNSVDKTLGVDVIATSHTTSHTTSTFDMADVNVYERDSLTETLALKSNAGDKKVSE